MRVLPGHDAMQIVDTKGEDASGQQCFQCPFTVVCLRCPKTAASSSRANAVATRTTTLTSLVGLRK